MKKYFSALIIFLCALSAFASQPLRMGIVTTPVFGTTGGVVYKDLRDYIAERTGRDITIVSSQDTKAVYSLLKRGKVDFVCGGALEKDSADTGRLIFIAIPAVHGKLSYRSAIIAGDRSKIKSLSDLMGHSFTFTNRMTGSGAVFPISLIMKTFGTTPDRVFSKLYYTRSNERSLLMVNRGVVDAAAVDGLIFNVIRKHSPKAAEHVRLIYSSKEMINPPFLASPRLDQDTLNRLRSVLSSMHSDPEGRLVLKEMDFGMIVPVNGESYQTAEAVRKVIDNFSFRPAHK